jgi:hypothetical protein
LLRALNWSVLEFFEGASVMNSLLGPSNRFVACALALCLTAFCTWRLGRGPLAEIAADLRETGHWQHVLAKHQADSADLEAALDRRRAHQKAKKRIISDLIAGRLSVHDAGRQYGELPDAPVGFREGLGRVEEGTTDHERLCRHLIDYACMTLGSESASRDLRNRLTQDLEINLEKTRARDPDALARPR